MKEWKNYFERGFKLSELTSQQFLKNQAAMKIKFFEIPRRCDDTEL